MGYTNQWTESTSYVTYADFDAAVAAEYKRINDEEMPENFLNIVYGVADEVPSEEMLERYALVSVSLLSREMALEEKYSTGVVVIQNDLSEMYYEKEEDFLREQGEMLLQYQDYILAFKEYCNTEYGENLNNAEVYAIFATENEELIDARVRVAEQMDDMYMRALNDMKDSGVIGGYVHKNGAMTPAYDLDTFNCLCGYMSTTQIILANMADIRLASMNATV